MSSERVGTVPPKVLQVGKFYPPHMGGIETHLEALCSALQRYVDLDVVVSSDDANTVIDVVDEFEVTRVGQWFTAASTAICPGMISAIRGKSAEIVHLHLPNPMGTLAYLASGHSGKLVVTYHSDTVRQRVLGMLFEPMLHALLRRSSAILATSQNYVESSQVLRVHRQKCHVIPLGVAVNKVAIPDERHVSQIRKSFGGDIILAVGRLVYYKGFEYVIRAMQSCPGHLLIIGDGPLRSELERLAGSLQVSDRVTFLGNRDEEIFPYYQAAKVFVLPSIARSEAFGIVQIEAMAAGIPVINTRINSGVPSVSLDGVTGLTVAPCDPIALAGAIQLLLSDERLRRAYGAAAKRRAYAEFTIEAMTARVLTVYEQVLGRGPLSIPETEWETAEKSSSAVLSAQN